jgi:N-acetylmuramoyl-L-alanine amidase
MRLLPLLAATLATSTYLTAQNVLFFRDRNLCAVPPLHTDVAAAMRQLCAGPDAAQAAQGLRSHLPRGTRLVACRRTGATVRVTFSSDLLRAAPGCEREHAVEQIDKTVLAAAGVSRCEIHVQRDDGSVVELGKALGRAPLPQPGQGQAQPGASLVASFGSLAGKRIAVSPGHGYYWHSSLGWTTQRGNIGGLIEDIHTAQIANRYLIPFLQNMGADVVFCREPGERAVDGLADNDQGAPAYTETGGWSTSASSGYQNSTYRFASSNPTVETATATWQIPVAEDGLYPVFAWFRASGNRTPEAIYRVQHSGGVDEVTVDQTVDNLTWAHLGNYWFTAQQGATVTLSDRSPSPGVVIADAVRLGGGLGSIVRGGTTSLQERWRECARYWAQFAGAPASVYNSVAGGQDNSDDVTARPRFAEWRTADAFVSLHTNAGGGSGTDTFTYSGGATAGSAALSNAVHTQIINDLRNEWNPSWVDRGQQQANFGELRLLSSMPGILVEMAFHDTPGSLDHDSLHEPEFRYLAARAYARGVLRYFAPLAPFPPEPPTALRVTQDGNRGLQVAWDTAPGATFYTVEQSLDGKGFVEVANVTTLSWSTGPLPHHSSRSFRVRAWNQTGRSFPTEVLTAGTDHLATAQALLVQGFDRLGRTVKGPENTRDYLARFGSALRRDARFSLGFDAASNEAVKLGRVALNDYDAVVWSLGEESTDDETLDTVEQFALTLYLNGGGALLVTGAEVGWDLDWLGSAGDRNFFRNTLGATYVADDAGTYTLQAGVPGTVSEGVAATAFDDGSGPTYDVDFPDVLVPTTANGTTCLRYGNGLGAGVQTVQPGSGARICVLGVPLETLLDDDVRAQLLQQTMAFLLDGQRLGGATDVTMGQQATFDLRLPGEAGMPFVCALSEAIDPPITLPLGGVLPLRDGGILQASLIPSPVFQDFGGTLDGAASAAPKLFVPSIPFLAGLDLYVAAFSFDPVLPEEREISSWLRVRLKL